MLDTAINKGLPFMLNLLLDISIFGFILKVNAIEDLESVVSLVTTICVLGLTVVRAYYFICDRKRNERKDSNK